jgi:hypothetical protein
MTVLYVRMGRGIGRPLMSTQDQNSPAWGSLCPETCTVARWLCRQIATEDAEASFRQIIDGESVDSQ